MQLPIFRSHRRSFALALLVGTAVHGGLVVYAARLPPPPAVLPSVAAPGFGELLLAPDLPQAAPPGDSGGGSPTIGRAARAEGDTAAPESAPAVEAKAPSPRAVAPRPPKVPVPDPSERAADEVPLDDLLALDELLSSDEASHDFPLRVEARPVWRTTLTRRPAQAPAMAGKRATKGAHAGLGPGQGGGPGGKGRGGRGGANGGNPFGGDHGAFTGRVCFLAPFTDSIKAAGRCTVEAILHTNRFNIPTSHFVGGFPGVARDEWFAILYDGAFSVARSGEYAFRLASDDGSILEIDGQGVIDNDGLHGPLVKRGTMYLKAGTHQLQLRYFQGPRQLVALQLWVTPPGGAERLFGPSF